jgi:serine/threonine protein phosphatase PrpC
VEKQIEADDEYLVLASDGVFDVIENDDVAKIVLRNARDFLNVAKRLCTEAIIMGSTDNVTALVIDLKYVALLSVALPPLLISSSLFCRQRIRLPTTEQAKSK